MRTETAAVCAEIHALGEQCRQELEAMTTRLEWKMLRRAIWAGLLSGLVVSLPLYIVVGVVLVRMLKGTV